MKLALTALYCLLATGHGRAHADTAYGSGLREAQVCIFQETFASLACFDRAGNAIAKSPITIDTSIPRLIVELRYANLFLRAGTANKLYFVRD